MNDATNFWLLAGTAAPIIALANVILLGDMLKLMLDFGLTRRENVATVDQKKWARYGYIAGFSAFMISYVNMGFQALVLINSLAVFKDGTGVISPKVTAGILIFGMFVLVGGTTLSSFARHVEARIKSASSEQSQQLTPESSDGNRQGQRQASRWAMVTDTLPVAYKRRIRSDRAPRTTSVPERAESCGHEP